MIRISEARSCTRILRCYIRPKNEPGGYYCSLLRSYSISTPSTPPILFQERNQVNDKRPRWSYTPERLKMPVRIRLQDPTKRWENNKDQRILDMFYLKLLGVGGDKLLSEEVKWLAVTHKSFEQGARGFNDRLAFLGRRILNLQTNLVLLSSSYSSSSRNTSVPSSDNRIPFEHPATDTLKNLIDIPLAEILSKGNLASFATSMGMRMVIRWYPRFIRDLEASGIETVLATSIYAIVGALALQNGGEVASNIARNNILKPMGVM